MDYKIGQKVNVTYNKSKNVLGSNPPKQGSEKVVILEKQQN